MSIENSWPKVASDINFGAQGTGTLTYQSASQVQQSSFLSTAGETHAVLVTKGVTFSAFRLQTTAIRDYLLTDNHDSEVEASLHCFSVDLIRETGESKFVVLSTPSTLLVLHQSTSSMATAFKLRRSKLFMITSFKIQRDSWFQMSIPGLSFCFQE